MIRLFYFTVLCLIFFDALPQKKKNTQVDSINIYISEGNYQKAITLLNKAIEQSPSADLLITRGLAKMEANDLSNALLDFNRSLKANCSQGFGKAPPGPGL